MQFTRQDIDEVFSRVDGTIKSTETVESVLKVLFEFSVIGYLSAGGRGGGSDYVWKYRDERAKFDNSATHFKVHPGFKDVLGLKKFTRSE